jgi:hypothetical protein
MGSDGTRPKVFGIGLSRTGTTSLGVALNELVVRTIHHRVFPGDLRDRFDYVLDNERFIVFVLDRRQGQVDARARVGVADPAASNRYFPRLERAMYSDWKTNNCRVNRVVNDVV